MAKRRRSGHSKTQLPKAAETIGFSEADEAFFQVADDVDRLAAVPDAPVPDKRRSFWRRLFA
jgi:hypothetical protein